MIFIESDLGKMVLNSKAISRINNTSPVHDLEGRGQRTSLRSEKVGGWSVPMVGVFLIEAVIALSITKEWVTQSDCLIRSQGMAQS